MHALMYIYGVSEQFLQVSFNGLLLGSTYPVRRSDADHSGGGAAAAILELLLHVPMGSHLQEGILLLELYQSSTAAPMLLGSAIVTGSQLRDLSRPSTSTTDLWVHLISASDPSTAMAKGRQRLTSSMGAVGPAPISAVSLQLRRSGDHDPSSSSSSSSLDDQSLSLVR
jgi:hypothetical protein